MTRSRPSFTKISALVLLFLLLTTSLAVAIVHIGEAEGGRGDGTWFIGHVKDKDTDDPIHEVEITIKKGETTYTAYTDAEGNYEKQVEGGGEYTLIAEHENYKTEDAHVVVETGDEKRVDFQLEKKEEETWILGKIRDKDTEEPINDVEISIKKGDYTHTTYTDEEGNYAKQFDTGGEFTVIAEKEGYKTEDAHVVVETGEEKRVDFQLEKKEEEQEIWFVGHVKDTETEDPIGEAEITIKKGEHEYVAYTNGDGNYEKQVEGGGEYTLIAEHEHYKTEDASAFVETGDEKRVDFDLEEKEEEQQTWFFGHVEDKETEDPIAEAEITIKKGEHDYVAYTNGDGNYEKQVEGGGEYTLIAEHENYKTEDASAFVETGDEKRVDFQLEKKEEERAWFFGQLKDKDTEDPIAEAKITIRKGDISYTAYTNGDGNYEKQVEGGGEYTLIAERNGYKTEDARAFVETGDEKRVDFDLEKKQTWFVGKVRNKETEDPIAEAEITIKKGDHSYTTYTDAEGNYEKQVEGGGEYTLIAEHAHYKTEDAHVVVETGDEKRVDFLLEKKEEEQETWFAGRVRDKETEEPIGEAEITIRKGDTTYTTYTNAEGHYEKQVEGGGEYTLIAEREGYKTEDAHVVVETGDEKHVDFLLEKKEEEERETWFFGYVKDKETEEPIGEAEIAIRKGDVTYSTLTNEEGYYAKQVEGGGEYTLIAEKSGYKTEDARALVETGGEKRVDFLLESEGGRGIQDVDANIKDEPDTFYLQILVILFVALLGIMMLVIYLPNQYFRP